ncbi:MAG: hypothetical protein J5U17_11630 [Candidatus Methanoperedens sp.]|nr:hypothetical protein [Candidatus Methanoperedens sp.]MCE8426413.1 hypothetical protein [Candidatus Methanoperedens sp.]MCE8429351.1 hypothetical protein [Candidatus Methanoperedens sp.]
MVKVEVVMDDKALLSRHMLNLKLIKLSWALFFILIGSTWILESLNRIDNMQKWAFIYAGSGAILLLLNMARIIWSMSISKFTVGLGALGIVLGVVKYFALGDISYWAAAILIIGIFMLFEVLRK